MLQAGLDPVFERGDKGLDKGFQNSILQGLVRGSVEKSPKKWKELRRAGYLAAIPALLAIGPILGWFLGDFLDGKLGTGPWLSYLGILVGFTAAGVEVYQLAKKAGEE